MTDARERESANSMIRGKDQQAPQRDDKTTLEVPTNCLDKLAGVTKPAYTVSEFADLFGRHKSWAYRLIYAGQIHVISEFGLMMVPASEVGRIIGTARRYTGK